MPVFPPCPLRRGDGGSGRRPPASQLLPAMVPDSFVRNAKLSRLLSWSHFFTLVGRTSGRTFELLVSARSAKRSQVPTKGRVEGKAARRGCRSEMLLRGVMSGSEQVGRKSPCGTWAIPALLVLRSGRTDVLLDGSCGLRAAPGKEFHFWSHLRALQRELRLVGRPLKGVPPLVALLHFIIEQF